MKKHLKNFHRWCDHIKLGKKVYGCIFNGLIGAETLEDDTEYPVCVTSSEKVKEIRRRCCRGRIESSSTPSHLSYLINSTPMNMNSIVCISEEYTGVEEIVILLRRVL